MPWKSVKEKNAHAGSSEEQQQEEERGLPARYLRKRSSMSGADWPRSAADHPATPSSIQHQTMSIIPTITNKKSNSKNIQKKKLNSKYTLIEYLQ